MRTFAEKPKATQQNASAKATKTGRAHFGQSHEVNSILHLQRTIGNQAVQRLLQANAEELNAGSATTASTRFAHDFSQIPLHPKSPASLQAKLTVNTPGDIYEQEADRVSEQVMRMPEPQLQRACACGGGCPKCQTEQPGREHERLQTKRFQASDTGQIAAPPIVHEVLRSPGQPLDPATRTFMETRFGHDFSRVSVHNDAQAAASAKAVGALAYTFVNHVAFAAGKYSPHSGDGRRLLAHELTHVMQQQGAFPRHNVSADSNMLADHVPETAYCGGAREDFTLNRERRAGVLQRNGDTDLIDDAYGAGSLDENQWRRTLDDAKQAIANGRTEDAERDYLALYADVATLAQASSVLGSVGAINVVTGSKLTTTDVKAGLNFSPRDKDGWGANATTGIFEEGGKFGVKLSLESGAPVQQVGIVLCRDAFKPNKADTLGVLRHELMHAEHNMQALDASMWFQLDPKARSKTNEQFKTWLKSRRKLSKLDIKLIEETADAKRANSELLGYLEGFMTVFHLTNPAPTSPDHRAFEELHGVLDVGAGEVLPWSEADDVVRSEALSRLQKYYCHTLDRHHRQAFDDWVNDQLTVVRRDRAVSGKTFGEPGSIDDKALEALSNPSSGYGYGASHRAHRGHEDFILGLQKIITNKCNTTSMKLEAR